MVIVGEWQECDDGEHRAIVRLGVEATDGQLVRARFLVDTGADRSVLDAATLKDLRLPHQAPPPGLSFEGIGGKARFVVVATVLHLARDDGGVAKIKGEFGAFTDPSAIDLSILGRDVLNHFDVIVSRRRNQVMLLGPGHQYSVNSQ